MLPSIQSDGDLFVNGRGILAELTAQAQLITELTAALTAMQEQAGFDPTSGGSSSSKNDLAWQIGVGVGAFVVVALAGGIAGWCIARRNKRMKKFSMNKGDFDYIVAQRLRERGRSTAGHEHRCVRVGKRNARSRYTSCGELLPCTVRVSR